MKDFYGNDFGIIALAKNYSETECNIQVSREISRDKGIQEHNFWLPAIKEIVEQKTKFGRIGIVFDRKNRNAESFCKELVVNNFAYKQKNIRSEKTPKVSVIKTQILREMANEGLADSVEFRRFIRKYTRNAKHLHLDSLLFLEGIFAEKKTKKIISQIAGSQIKTYFVTDFLEEKPENSSKKIFNISTEEDLVFTKKRAEEILQRKLKDSDLSAV